MKAWTVSSIGPWRISIRDVAGPIPLANEAVVSVAAFSINRGEMELLSRLPESWVPGHDVAGIVLEPAADGSGPPRGARVVGLVDRGAWAERVAIPTSALAVVPEGVTLVQAAALPVAGLCAVGTVRLAACAEGASVLVTGAAGGVGSFQVQLAARCGARVVAVTSRLDAAAWLRTLGATDVVPCIAKAQGPFDAILESAGGTSLAEAIRKVAPGGTIVLSGNSSQAPTPLSLFDFIGHEGARLVTFMNYASYGDASVELQSLVIRVERGEVAPHLGRVSPWDALPDTLEALHDRGIGGKAVLCIPSGGALDGQVRSMHATKPRPSPLKDEVTRREERIS